MKITSSKVNHFINPIGYFIEKPTISWKVKNTKSKKQNNAIINVSLDLKMGKIIYTKEGNLDQRGTPLDLELVPETRYYYQIQVEGDKDQAISDIYYFETAKDKIWQGKFIGGRYDSIIVCKKIELVKKIKSARLYICGLGLYEAYLNKKFVNDEYLMPGYHCYNDYLQYQTYDITDQLEIGSNELEIILGNGWYKGRLGYEGGFRDIYGKELATIFEIHICYEDGENEIIVSDKECKIKTSPIIQSGIYDGEFYDARKEENWKTLETKIIDLDKKKLIPRLSLPIVVIEKRKPVKKIISPKGECILDFGQNLTGWVETKTNQDIDMYFCEVLQDGCFYDDNYRTATYGYHYKANGKERNIRPHFTYFGFRYVKVVSNKPIHLEDFNACLISSKLDKIGLIETGNKDINQLISNAYYSQIDNFLDIPSDCPQRDERLGWTGDAQVFSDTACYQCDTSAFYNKYLFDMLTEQRKRQGGVPNIIPVLTPQKENYALDYAIDQTMEKAEKLIGMYNAGDSSPWGDAATIIPWNVYQHDGDLYQLERNYQNMKLWVDHIMELDQKNGNHHLYDFGFHFADWLSLDNPNETPFGKTDMYYVSSVFYYYSTRLVSYVAKILNKEEYKKYTKKAEKIKEAIRNKYMENGVLTINTQTAYVLALYFDLLKDNEKEKHILLLVEKINEVGHIDTGFVGTAYINDVLASYGKEDLAYDIFLREDYPGWIYQIKLGATTIWERWNSILPDGKMNSDGMNSLNHYAYGSIVGWLYRYAGGLKPLEGGFKKVKIEPKFDERLQYVHVVYDSVMGKYDIQWKYNSFKEIQVDIKIPYNCEAIIKINQEEKICFAGNYSFVVKK